ncbi:MAG: polysaccharide deacetylase family protein [Candidatus Omnitrophica bacterium]|nr:polysaccharide deacetylase family protein [Candidatus Omnitrophota bacterium]
MNIRTITETAIHALDHAASKAGNTVFKAKPSLMIFVFHGLFINSAEIEKNLVDPQQNVTVDGFRKFVEYFYYRKYSFVSPEDILNGLDNGISHIMITFDDGYYNNIRALPILREFKIPAVFFITTNNVKHNTSFWWDIIYRENRKRGVGLDKIAAEEQLLKKKTVKQIKEYIHDKYGRGAFNPVGDTDRPFTPEELKKFSEQDFVSLGNHTSDHAILTGYPPGQICARITEAQSYLHGLTGKWPAIISYPNGSHSPKVTDVSRELGLHLGVTLEEKKNLLPLVKIKNKIALGRFFLLGGRDINRQCDILCSDIMLYIRLKNILKTFIPFLFSPHICFDKDKK